MIAINPTREKEIKIVYCLYRVSTKGQVDKNIDKLTLTKLRGECVKEVKRLNGSFSFDDAYDWQKG